MAATTASRVTTTSSVKRERRISIGREMQVHTTPGSNVSKLRHLFEASKSATTTTTQPVPARKPIKPLNRTTPAPTTNGIGTKAPPTITSSVKPSNTAYLKQNAPKNQELNSNIKPNATEELNSSITDKSVDPHKRFALALKKFERSSSQEQLDEPPQTVKSPSPTHKKYSPPSSPPAKKPFSRNVPPSSDSGKENKPIRIEATSISTTKRSPDYNPYRPQLHGGDHYDHSEPEVITDYHPTNSNESSPTRDISKNRKNNSYNVNLENERLSPKTSPRRSPSHLSSPNHAASDIIALQRNVDLSKELNLELEGSGDSHSEGDTRSPSSPFSPLSKKFPAHGNQSESHEIRRGFRKYSQEPEEEKVTSTESESTHTSMSDVTVEEREVFITPKTVELTEECPPSRLDNLSSEDIEFVDAIPDPDIPDDHDDTFQSDSMEDLQKEAMLQEALRGVSYESDNSPQRESRSQKMAIALSMDETNVDDDDELYEEEEEGEESEYTDQDISKALEDSTEDVKYSGVDLNTQRFIELSDTGLEDESMEAMDEENSADDTVDSERQVSVLCMENTAFCPRNHGDHRPKHCTPACLKVT